MTGEVVQFQRARAETVAANPPPSYGLFALAYVVCILAAVGVWDIGLRIAALFH